ncbi:DDE family transposase [Rathayibacter iranicus]|uniref:DDE family transposase n=1 Tax=Rathayibacter iranicus NCPPB 2253 = VKM Ac-1602 TaxID=1328868 RepID=A0ABX5LE50_9MICO|nr:DDE family transposase [Rathayibacter iranicus] [Rathayibacter iranicus NCPPB 2253 = VKM Ac-1602]
MLGQVQTRAESNEIPELRDLLDRFTLEGVVVTADAMHTPRDIAEHIIAAGGHYLLTVKKNQPSLHRLCKNLPLANVPGSTEIDTGHGVWARRTIKVLSAPPGLEFPHTLQVAQLRRTRTVKGRQSVEVVYLICSLDHS